MMSFKLREFGSTSYTLSPVGFGAWAAGGGGWNFSWGFQDDADTIAAIRRAVGHGVNWIDTAPAYGHGHSEEVVGRAIADIPASERPYVFTKCGLEWNPHNHMERSRRVGDPAVLRRSVEESLRRLDVEVLDLLFMHWPAADGTPLETYWRTLLDLKSEGKVRAVGLSNHPPSSWISAKHWGTSTCFRILSPPCDAIWRRSNFPGAGSMAPPSLHTAPCSPAFSADPSPASAPLRCPRMTGVLAMLVSRAMNWTVASPWQARSSRSEGHAAYRRLRRPSHGHFLGKGFPARLWVPVMQLRWTGGSQGPLWF